MREVWELDTGWTYTVFHSTSKGKEPMKHAALTLPATLSAEGENGEILLEKQIHIAEEWTGKRFLLWAKGINQTVAVALNGIPMGNVGLWGMDVLDLTYAMELSATNQLQITCACTSAQPLMAEGFSLYCVSPCFIAPYGVAYTVSQDKEGGCLLHIDTTVSNQNHEASHIRLVHTLTDSNGKKEAQIGGAIHALGFSAQKERKTLTVPAAVLDNPQTHTIITELYAKNELLDRVYTPCVIRQIKADARRGLLLNKTPVKLHGMEECSVPQNRITPASLLAGESQRLLQTGINAVSLPYDYNTEERLSIYDEIDIFAIVRLPMTAFGETGFDALGDIVKRLRHHPSLIMWSFEDIPFVEGDPRATAIILRGIHEIKCEDEAHPITVKVNITSDERVMQAVQVLTVTGTKEEAEDIHKAFSGKPILLQTLSEQAFLPAYHAIAKGYYVGHIQQVPAYLSGETPCESGIFRLWMFAPRLMAQMRACYQQKEDVLDLQLGETEGDTQTVTLLTNCESTGLWVDGRPYGGTVKTRSPDRTVRIPKDFGYAEAVGFRGGRETARVQLEPTGNPYALSLSVAYAPERQAVGDIIWVSCAVLDTEGREVSHAEGEVRFAVGGGACLDSDPSRSKEQGLVLRLTNGHAALSLRRTELHSPISVEVDADLYIPTSLLLK